MISMIVKIAFLAIVILVGLKIFMPDVANDAVNKISTQTGIDKSIINDNLNKATSMAIDGADKLTDIAKEQIDTAKDKLDNK